jgi:hypothetical protein
MATPEKPELSAIDILRNAANLKPMRKMVELNNGSVLEFWHTPLTAAERAKVNKEVASDEPGEFIMQLLIAKATNESGEKLFSRGHIASLRREVREEDLQKLQISILNNEKDQYYDPKP